MRLKLVGVWVVSVFLCWTSRCVRSIKYEKLEQFEIVTNGDSTNPDEGYNNEAPDVIPTTGGTHVDSSEEDEEGDYENPFSRKEDEREAHKEDSNIFYTEEEDEKPKNELHTHQLEETLGSNGETEEKDLGEKELENIEQKEEDLESLPGESALPIQGEEVEPLPTPEHQVEDINISHEKHPKFIPPNNEKSHEEKHSSDLLDNKRASSKRIYDTLLKEDNKADHLPNEHVEGDKKFPDYPLISHNQKLHSKGTHYSNKPVDVHGPDSDDCECNCDPTCTESEVVKTDGNNNPISYTNKRTCYGAVPRGLKARRSKRKGKKSKKRRRRKNRSKKKRKGRGKKKNKRRSKKRSRSVDDEEEVGAAEEAIDIAKMSKKKARKAEIKAKKARAAADEAELKAKAKEKRMKAELEVKQDEIEEDQAEIDSELEAESKVNKSKKKGRKGKGKKNKNKKHEECNSDFDVPKCSD